MKTKDNPEINGIYWMRHSSTSAWRICEVNDGTLRLMGDMVKYYLLNYRGYQWIGPIIPDGVEVYVTKEK